MEKCTTSGDAAMILRRKSALFNAYVAEIAVLNNEAEIKEASDPDASSWSLEQEEEEESESDAAFLAHPYCGATLEDIWCGDYLRTGQDGMYENLLILCECETARHPQHCLPLHVHGTVCVFCWVKAPLRCPGQVCYPLRQVLPSRLLRPNTAWKYLHFVRVRSWPGWRVCLRSRSNRRMLSKPGWVCRSRVSSLSRTTSPTRASSPRTSSCSPAVVT